MKAIITQDDVTKRVTVSYDADEAGDRRITREFSCGQDGKNRYVQELDGKGGSRQVCKRLAGMGETLMADTSTLLDVIRREYRAMRRAEKNSFAN